MASTLEALRAALYGTDITEGDIPVIKANQAEHDRRLTRVEWAIIAILVATGAQGLGAVIGGLR